MGIDHRRAQIPVAEELLDRADVVAVLKKVRREGVPERMASRGFVQARAAHCVLDGALQDRFVEVVPAPLAGQPIDMDSCRRKDPLPGPLPSCRRILPPQGAGQRHPSCIVP